MHFKKYTKHFIVKSKCTEIWFLNPGIFLVGSLLILIQFHYLVRNYNARTISTSQNNRFLSVYPVTVNE